MGVISGDYEMSVPTGAGNYPSGVSDSHPYFTDESEEEGGDEEHQVQCADCFKWFDMGDNHTCRQQIRRNRRQS